MLEELGLEVELYRFTVERYEAMAQAGLLPERGVELVDGLLVDMSAEGDRHAETRRRLLETLSDQRRGRYHVYPGLSVRLGSRDMVDPDGTLVRWAEAGVSIAVAASDVALVVEIADTSLDYDLGIKREKYATAAIPEYWIVDLRADRVHIFARPDGSAYGIARVATRDETIAPLEFPDIAVVLSDVFSARG